MSLKQLIYKLWEQKVPHPLSKVATLMEGLQFSHPEAESKLFEKVTVAQISNDATPEERNWFKRFQELCYLRALVFGAPMQGPSVLHQAFCFRVKHAELDAPKTLLPVSFKIDAEVINETATEVSNLYLKLLDTAKGAYPELTPMAIRLMEAIFGKPWNEAEMTRAVQRLTDMMQTEEGIPFFILNLLHWGDFLGAQKIAQILLLEELSSDDDRTSALYWMSELSIFSELANEPIAEYDKILRHIYHFCFTLPERSSFTEIDSPFFSQFETLNESAREGFLFKEALIDRVMELWKGFEGVFDPVFQNTMERLTRRKNKIYDTRSMWQSVWNLERETLDREYLHVVEGNLCYVQGHFADALAHYEAALQIKPNLRSALLNSLFANVKLERWDSHNELIERILKTRSLLPSAWYAIGNSFLLAGKPENAEIYYSELRKLEPWNLKVNHYKSTFCHEHGLHDEALKYALEAFEENPTDPAICYQVSVCYYVVGQKDKALEFVQRLNQVDLEWMNFYRFTLERDIGRHFEASETLKNISQEYFDEDELEEAISFAKERRDFTLLKHLNKINQK